MAAAPFEGKESIPLADGYEFDLRPRRLRRGSRVLKLERIPLEILLLLIEHSGEVVNRDQISSRIWASDVHLDTDNSIRGAIRKLRRVLKDDPETPRFIQTVTGQGYRFIGTAADPPINREEPPNRGEHPNREEPPDEQGVISETAAAGRAGRRRQWLLAGALAALCGVIVVSAVVKRWPHKSDASPLSRKTVLAVLPFENLSRDPDEEFFSDGLTEEMIAQAGKLNRNRLAVVARSSVAKYKGSKLSAKEMASELNADYLLQSSVRRFAGRVRITVQLIRAQDQTDLWTETYDRELRDIIDVQDSVVQTIARQMNVALAEEEAPQSAGSRRVSPDAYVAYLKGRYYWNKRSSAGIEKAEKYFLDAVQIDPTDSAAYSGLADCNSGLTWHGFRAPADTLPKAADWARKAVKFNPQSGEAHASLGLVLSHQWEWAEAEREFKVALQLDPQYANTHHWYGDYLSIHEHHKEALSEARRALELDPLNLMISTWVGLRLYLSRDYVAAIKQNQDSVEMDPNFAAAHLLLGEEYIQTAKYDDAVNEVRRAATLAGDSALYTAQVGVALAAAGRTREATEIADSLQQESARRYVSPYGLAQIYAAMQRDEDTFKWLQAAYEGRAVWMGYLAVDPVFDRYHGDKRFQELVNRVGLR